MIPPAEWIAIAAAPFVGSFLGVVADRLPAGRSLLWPRSHCESCGAALSPAAMVPILGWVALSGRCAACAAPIPRHLLAIELAALAGALVGALLLDGPAFWAGLFLLACLLALGFADWRYMVLADPLLAVLAVGAVVWALIGGELLARDMLIGAFAGGGVFWLLALGYRRLRGREGLGFGDVKLMAAAGLWVGWQGLPSVALIGALTALTAVLAVSLFGRRRLDPAARLPFGPALCLALWFVWTVGPIRL